MVCPRLFVPDYSFKVSVKLGEVHSAHNLSISKRPPYLYISYTSLYLLFTSKRISPRGVTPLMALNPYSPPLSFTTGVFPGFLQESPLCTVSRSIWRSNISVLVFDPTIWLFRQTLKYLRHQQSHIHTNTQPIFDFGLAVLFFYKNSKIG